MKTIFTQLLDLIEHFVHCRYYLVYGDTLFHTDFQSVHTPILKKLVFLKAVVLLRIYNNIIKLYLEKV